VAEKSNRKLSIFSGTNCERRDGPRIRDTNCIVVLHHQLKMGGNAKVTTLLTAAKGGVTKAPTGKGAKGKGKAVAVAEGERGPFSHVTCLFSETTL